MRFATLAALVAVAAATRRDAVDSRHCRGVLCDSLSDFEAANCGEGEVAQKIFQPGVMDDCCATFKCVIDPENPCATVECKVTPVPTDEEPDIAAMTAWCNDNLFPEDPTWNNIQPEFGTQYAFLVRKATGAAGRCCDEFRCKTDYDLLCDNLNAKTPCPTAATCPLCHSLVVRTPKNAAEGRCCDEIACVPDPQCLCETTNGKESTNCPEPPCDQDYEGTALQYPVTLYEADPAAGRCCPVRTCQDDLVAICQAEQDRVAWDEGTLCSACETLQVIEEADFLAGKCFPTYKCIPNGEVCCGFDPGTCVELAAMPELGECESWVVDVPADSFVGPCCTVYKVETDHACVCDLKDTAAGGDACEFPDEDAYMAAKCPDVDEDGDPLYEIEISVANRDEGRCCDLYKCVKSAALQLKQLRKEKGPKAGTTRATN